jgi:hypothetical protein
MIKPNKLDTLIDLIMEIECSAYHTGNATKLDLYDKFDLKLAKAKTKAFKIIHSLRK